jgi:hypothetical protein
MIKVDLQEVSAGELARLRFYLLFYELKYTEKHNIPNSKYLMQTIEQYQHFIELADILNDEEATKWGRKCLQNLMSSK